VHPARGNTKNGTLTGVPPRITTNAGKRGQKTVRFGKNGTGGNLLEIILHNTSTLWADKD